jgi:hypothetical protein
MLDQPEWLADKLLARWCGRRKHANCSGSNLESPSRPCWPLCKPAPNGVEPHLRGRLDGVEVGWFDALQDFLT